MAKAKRVTPHNTGLSITHDGGWFKATWKKKVSDANTDKQSVRWRRYHWQKGKWSGWTTAKLAKGTTSSSYYVDPSYAVSWVQVQTQILAKDTTSINYSASAWADSSSSYQLWAPATPSLEMAINSSNETVFSWSEGSGATGHDWFTTAFYQSKCDASPDGAGGWPGWAVAGTSSYPYVDGTTGTARIFQIYARGPGGSSGVNSARHYLGPPTIATWGGTPVSFTDKTSYYSMTYNININGPTGLVDSVVPQWLIDKPTSSMAPSSGASWNDGATYTYRSDRNSYAMPITTNDTIGPDECLWGRIKTTHDGIDRFSDPYRIRSGKLTDPDLTISMGTPTPSGFTVSITVTDWGTDVPGVYMEVFLEKASNTGLENYIKIGTIANGSASASISSGIDLTHETGFAIHCRNVTADGKSMTSGYYTYKTTMPAAPTINSVVNTTTSGKVYLSWTNNWADATGAIIAWTDDPDNWTSNDDPETYEIKETASNWFITGLETGKTWYFRIRSTRDENDNETLSSWSADVPIDLSSAPAVPLLYLSDDTITEDGMVTAYWSYVSTDGTGQISGNVVEATYSGGVWTYGASVGATTDAQHIDIYAADNGWTNGSVVYLALQTRSGSGGLSEYSTPVKLVIAEKPTVAITTTGFSGTESLTEYFLGDGVTDTFQCGHTMTSSPTVTVEGAAATVTSYTGGSVVLATVPDDGDNVVISYTTADNKVLEEFADLTATVTTTNARDLTIAIERAASYPMLRPDGTETTGAEGETIYVDTFKANATNSIAIDKTDLIGRLDDGAYYRLIATATDEFGQSVEASVPFRVHWSHQAWRPTATFITDADNYIVRITPVAGADYVSGDTCDIYRMSMDGPELIYSEAQFGTEYVDPYPAFGVESGYKIVTITGDDDYITPDNEFAEYDTTYLDPNPYTQLDPGLLVIDCGMDRIELPYNIGLGNSWEKDFERTTYLGGHITGDHNKAVTRDLSATTVIVRGDDTDIEYQMRALARYAGLCHVRTPEGSSFVADVQVSESQGYDKATVDYSLTIQKVDTVGYDGMTYAEWYELQEEESS